MVTERAATPEKGAITTGLDQSRASVAQALRGWVDAWAVPLPLLLLLAVFLVLPIVALFARSLTGADGIGLSTWSDVLQQPLNQRAIGTSLVLGLACASISVLVGAPLAWLISRMLSGRRAAWLGILNVAAHFGGIGLAFAYIATLGAFGMLTLFLRGLGLPFDPPARDSLAALVITYEYANIPLFVLLTVPVMGILREEWAEAAETSGATWLQFWRRIGLPVLAPFLGAGFVLSFTWSIGIYGIAYGLAGESGALPIQLLTLQIGEQLANDAIRGPGRAAVLAVLLMAIALVALAAYRLLLRRGMRWFAGGAVGTGELAASASDGRRVTVRRRSIGSVALFGLFAAYLALPVIAVVLYSFAGRWTSSPLPDVYTLRHWAEALGSPRILDAFATSLSLGAWTTLVVMALAVPAVYWSHIRNRRLRPLLELAAAIPFALPFVVIGFAVLSFSGTFMPQLQGTYPLVVMCYAAVSFPFVYWALDGAMSAADVRRLHDAAAACGASARQTLTSVVLPNIRSGLVTAAILAFALGIGEFALIKVLAGSTNSLPIWTARAMRASGDSLAPVAVVTTLVFIMLFVLSALVAYVNRGQSGRVVTGMGPDAIVSQP